jgi:hypothetical protein
MKFPSIALAAVIAAFGLVAFNASAQAHKLKTVAALYKEKTELAGQTVSISGKVVKVNNEIMGRNWLHVQDGTGEGETGDLVVTSEQTAKVGDEVMITGLVTVNKDFGSGYAFTLMIEQAKIIPKK